MKFDQIYYLPQKNNKYHVFSCADFGSRLPLYSWILVARFFFPKCRSLMRLIYSTLRCNDRLREEARKLFIGFLRQGNQGSVVSTRGGPCFIGNLLGFLWSGHHRKNCKGVMEFCLGQR